MSRELIGDGDEGRVLEATSDVPVEADIGDLEGRRRGGDLSGDLAGGVTKESDGADGITEQRPRVGGRAVFAVAASCVFAVMAGAVAGQHQAQRAVITRAAAATRLVMWIEDYPARAASAIDGGRSSVLIHLTATGAIPLTVERLDLRIAQATPARTLRLEPGKPDDAAFTLAISCFAAGIRVGGDDAGTAIVRTDEGEQHRIPVTAVAQPLEGMADAVCDSEAPLVDVTRMRATREGAIVMRLRAAEGAPASIVWFTSTAPSVNGGPGWVLTPRPQTPVRVPAGGAVTVTVGLEYRGCLGAESLPPTGGLLRLEVSTADGGDAAGDATRAFLFLDGWDDSVVTAAATAAVLLACG